MTNIIEKALRMSAIAHNGQKRKEQDAPYIIHPVAVALLLAKNDFSDVVIASALVHDVLEDTSVTEEELKKELGEEVLSIVQSLSENMSIPWEERKTQYIETIRVGSENVKAVSVGDKINNAQSMLTAYEKIGPELWKVFHRGKEKQIWFYESHLDMLKKTWNNPLVNEYENLVQKLKTLD